MALNFRNVDADPADPVGTWPYEALVTAVERGGLEDWHRIAAVMHDQPWGSVARRVETYLSYEQPPGLAWLLAETLRRARSHRQAHERERVAQQVRDAVEASGLTKAEFAAAVGTSQSRLSTYCSGQVTPSAALLVRMADAADAARHGPDEQPRSADGRGR